MINFYNYLTDKKVSQSIYEMLFDKFMQTDEPTYREYTGTLPITITANGSDLTDWIIYGNTGGVGNKTANLFNEVYPNIDSSLHYLAISVGNGDFTLSTTCLRNQSGACLFFLAGNVSSGASTENNGVWGYSGDSYGAMNRTQTAINGYVTIAYRSLSTDLNPVNKDTILNSGSTAQNYEPYGYKISILSNSEPVNIYIDDPLDLNETVSFTDTNVHIPTDNGTTVISCDNTVQPEKIYIKYIGG